MNVAIAYVLTFVIVFGGLVLAANFYGWTI